MEISKEKSLSAIGSFYHNFGSKTGYFENSVHWFNIVLRQKLDITSNFYGANGLFHPVSGLKAAQSDCALLGTEIRHMESSKKLILWVRACLSQFCTQESVMCFLEFVKQVLWRFWILNW